MERRQWQRTRDFFLFRQRVRLVLHYNDQVWLCDWCYYKNTLEQFSWSDYSLYYFIKDSQRKNYSLPSTNSQADEVKARSLSSSPPQTPNTTETTQNWLENEKSSSSAGDIKDSKDQRNGKSYLNFSGSRSGTSVSLSHRESISESTGIVHNRSSSVNSETSFYGDLTEVPMIDQEDINTLTIHVKSFSEAVSSLRNTFVVAEGGFILVVAPQRK